jgi:hypothetical protein
MGKHEPWMYQRWGLVPTQTPLHTRGGVWGQHRPLYIPEVGSGVWGQHTPLYIPEVGSGV